MQFSKPILTTAALATFIAGAALAVPSAQATSDHEKCAGVAKAGKNDCQANGHSCAGQAKVDDDPNEWVSLPKGICDKIAGGRILTK